MLQKLWRIIDQLNDCQLLKKDSVPRIRGVKCMLGMVDTEGKRPLGRPGIDGRIILK
jgi:hypothetical protein